MKRVPKLPHWPPRLTGRFGQLHWRIAVKLMLAVCTAAVLTAIVFAQSGYYRVNDRHERLQIGRPVPIDIIAPSALSWQPDTLEALPRSNDVAMSHFTPQAQTTALADIAVIYTLLKLPDNADTQQLLTRWNIPTPLQATARNLPAPAFENLRHITEIIAEDIIREGSQQNSTSAEQATTRMATLIRERVVEPQRAALVSTIAQATVLPTLERITGTPPSNVQAANAPGMRSVAAGDVLLHRGDTLTAGNLRQLVQFHIVHPFPWARLLPIALLMLFAVCSLGAFLQHSYRAVYDNFYKLFLLALLLVAPLWLTLTLGQDQALLVGLVVIPGAAMAIAGLLGIPVAIVSSILISVIAGMTADQQYSMILLTLGSALIGIMSVAAIWPASRGIQTVLLLSIVNLLLLAVIEWIHPGLAFPFTWSSVGTIALWAMAGGFGSCLIAVGAIYLLARPFGILTHYRLMEMSNSKELLLRRMMLEAPGSYHSSVMVANMAEAAADAIGANALLTRVAALYHDIGKLKRPAFFVENQAPLGIENVHQRLSPKLSYLILTSHVRDGAEFARQHKLPEEVASIIREHHGTTLAAYFYHRAVNEANGETVPEHEFRYPGPKPSTREAAVVMLADSVQASVKSLKEPSPGRIESMVRDIITNRLEDGQLEDCDITLRDLRRLSEVFNRILTGLYTYTRLEYPDLKGEGTRLRANLNPASTPTTGEPTSVTHSS